MEKNKIFNKHILFDTNVLIEISKAGEKIQPLFDLFEVESCVYYIIDAVYFEFLRCAKNGQEYQKFNEWLKNFPMLSSRKEDVENAIRLSTLYRSKNSSRSINQISYTDCLIAAQLMKYKSNVILVTTDLNDYPDIIFDRLNVKAFDLTKKVVTVGFIRFNQAKYDKVASDFEKSTKSLSQIN